MARRSVSSRQPNLPSGLNQIPKPSRRERWLGTKPQELQIPIHTNEGMQALQALLTQGLQGIQNPQAGFEPIRQNVLNTYNQDVVPSIAQRFASMGSGGALNSSGLLAALGQSGENLGQKLGGLEAEYGLKNRQGLLDMLQLGLTPQYNYQTIPGQPGNIEKWLLPAGRTAASLLNFIPGLGPLLSGAAQGGLDVAQNALSSQRGGGMSQNPFASFGQLTNQNTIQSLRDWMQDRRNRAKSTQSSSLRGGYGGQGFGNMPYGTNSFASLPGGY